jgi:catechol 2,3-dioxygenase-like lactoylglutathione lyase family enzyme
MIAMPLGHLGVNVPDLVRAKKYYDTVMPLLGYETFLDRPDEFAYKPAEGKVGTYIFFYPSLDSGEYSRHRTGLQHLAFMVKSRGVVEEVHRVIVALGGEVVHEPREFPEYHPGYYATFWLDPYGQMLEAVCHKTATGEA